MTPAALGLAIAGLMTSGFANAATKINGDIWTFTKTDTQHVLTARPDSFYNLTMGFLGWTHHSAWGNVKLKKGQVYTITAIADPLSGIHPAIGVWYRPQGSGLVPNTYAYDHFYNQWANIFAKNQTDEADGKKLGTLKQFFATNGVDRDGWDLTDPDIYDQSMVTRILDGVVGKVQVQFRAADTGWYQFVIGAMNPDTGVDLTKKYPIQVTVEGL